MNEKTIILVTFASIVLAACTAGITTAGGQAKPAGSAAAGSLSWISPKPSGKSEGGDAKICTLDAKQCPDGSFVSRNPANNCVFNPCPGEPK